MGVTRESGCIKPALLSLLLVAYGASWLSCSAQTKHEAENAVMRSTAVKSGASAGQSDTVYPETAADISSKASNGFSKPYGYHLRPILQAIGASEEQSKRITEIVHNYRPKIEPLRIEYRKKSKEFLDFIIQGKSAELIMARQGELNNLYGVIITQYSLMRLEIRRMLTPQQCVAFENYRAKQGWRQK